MKDTSRIPSTSASGIPPRVRPQNVSIRLFGTILQNPSSNAPRDVRVALTVETLIPVVGHQEPFDPSGNFFHSGLFFFFLILP